jgi:hypothetical protein
MHPDLGPMVGSWRLSTVEATFSDTGERAATFGPDPNGRMMLSPCGRITFLIMKSNRSSAPNDAARATLCNETIAWSGTVRPASPGEFVTKVEVSLFPEEIGTEKPRRFRLDGDRFIITVTERTSRVTHGRLAVSELIWRREYPAADVD